MLQALNYQVWLYYLCLDLILQLRYTSNRVTKSLVQLILVFGVRLRGKEKKSGHLVISGCFQNLLFLKQSVNNNEMWLPNSLDRDQPRSFYLKSAGLSEP